MKNEIPIVRERIQTVWIINIYDFMMQKSQHQYGILFTLIKKNISNFKVPISDITHQWLSIKKVINEIYI